MCSMTREMAMRVKHTDANAHVGDSSRLFELPLFPPMEFQPTQNSSETGTHTYIHIYV